jgi:hypothetical protein
VKNYSAIQREFALRTNPHSMMMMIHRFPVESAGEIQVKIETANEINIRMIVQIGFEHSYVWNP